jgi:cytochrome b pre-mRNA-processing protein 3
MPLARLFRRSVTRDTVHAAYAAAVAQAREPAFYADHGVPDTLDGRYEMIMLHIFLILHRLRDMPQAKDFGQALFDLLFADMDRNLREIGVGDLSVGKHVKRMAQSFYGRAAAYQDGLAGAADLGEALRRNLYGTVGAPDPVALQAMAGYLARQAAHLAAAPAEEITTGRVRFLPVAEAFLC